MCALGVVGPAFHHRQKALPDPSETQGVATTPGSQPGLLLLDEACHVQLLIGREVASDIPLYDQLELLCPYQAAWREKVF